eukprot:m51a1_g14728 hypothetical protein (413) ;mRNA; f:219634-221922
MSAMREHSGVASVLKQACRALCNLAYTAEGTDSVKAAGGVEAVVVAMRHFPGEAEIQEYGLAALFNCARGVAPAMAERNARLALAALSTFSQNSVVVQHAMDVLGKLAVDDEGERVVVSLGALPAIVAAAEHHRLLLGHAFMAVANMASDPAALVDVAARCKALAIASLSDSSSDRSLRRSAFICLIRVSRVEGTCEELMSSASDCSLLASAAMELNADPDAAGAFSVLVSRMGATSRQVPEPLISAVVTLLKTEEIRKDLRAATAACQAVKLLGVNSENETRAAALGAIEAVVGVLREHCHLGHDPTDLIRVALSALFNYIDIEDNVRRIGAADGVEVTAMAMLLCTTSAEVQESGLHLLKFLPPSLLTAQRAIPVAITAMQSHETLGVQRDGAAVLALSAASDLQQVRSP